MRTALNDSVSVVDGKPQTGVTAKALLPFVALLAVAMPVCAQDAASVASPAKCRFEDAADYGFLPTAEPAQNVAALQKALDGGNKTLTVSRPGVYQLNGTVYLDDNTKVVFGEGVLLKKTGSYTFVFVNRGALTRTWNKNITLDGLNLSVNQVEAGVPVGQPLYGLRGHISMYFIRNLVVSNYRCLDLGRFQFGIHVCKFDNIKIDTFEIRGNKDGVHLGMGEKFVVRDGICETFDDAVALNAEDYPSCQPMQGDIKDGLVENIYDIKKTSTSGNFSRLLTGAWVDWHDGIRLQTGDTVVNGANVYRVVMPLGTTEYVSHEAPVHTEGAWKDSSGLQFVFNQNDGVHQASIRDVTFSNIFLHDKRTGFACHWESGKYHRAVHPEVRKTDYPVCEVKLINIHCFEPTTLFSCNSQARVLIDKITPTGCLASFRGQNVACSLLVTAATFARREDASRRPDIRVSDAVAMDIRLESVMQDRDIELGVADSTRTRINGTASVANLNNITPMVGDSIKVKNVRKTYNGTQWE